MSLNNNNIIFDFDSTIIQLETIEVIAEIALKNNSNKKNILEEIKTTTSLAMNGEIPFDVALNNRLSLLNIQKNHIDKTIKYLKTKLTKSFVENIDFINKNLDKIFIISGGFKEIILPILAPYKINEKNIYANTFIYNKSGTVESVNLKNPLSKNKGKCMAAKNIKGNNIIIGDGYTDFELKKNNFAKLFILFTENVSRNELKKDADFIANNFNEAFNYIKNVTKE